MPKSSKTMAATNRIPPITVKSHLVWNAKSVRPKQTAAVMPTPSSTWNMRHCLDWKCVLFMYRERGWSCVLFTVSAGTLDVITPNKNVCANVNSPKNTKFIGKLRRTFVQQAMAIIVMKSTAKATQNISGWLRSQCLVPSWYTQRAMNANDTLSWHWKWGKTGFKDDVSNGYYMYFLDKTRTTFTINIE